MKYDKCAVSMTKEWQSNDLNRMSHWTKRNERSEQVRTSPKGREIVTICTGSVRHRMDKAPQFSDSSTSSHFHVILAILLGKLAKTPVQTVTTLSTSVAASKEQAVSELEGNTEATHNFIALSTTSTTSPISLSYSICMHHLCCSVNYPPHRKLIDHHLFLNIL